MQAALIVGGGIAGPVTALALRKAGVDARVFEAYDRSAEGVGAFLTLAANGIDALRTLGIDDVVLAEAFATPRLRLHGASGSALAADISLGSLPDGTPAHTLRRSALYSALRRLVEQSGTPIEYGKRLVDAVSGPDGVTAYFADGSTATADVLVGADGLRSRTREVIDPHAPAASYVGLLDLGGYATGVDVDAEPGVMHLVFGRRCFFGYVQAPDGQVWWFANPPSPDEEHAAATRRISQQQWREYLLGLFARDRSPAAGLVRATPGLLAGWGTYDFPSVPTWHRDRMVIVGDAAHATSPSSGQGASQAIEDAVVLAKCLRDVDDVPEALTAFEGLRRERVEKVVAMGRRNGHGKSGGWFTRVVVLPLVFKMVARRGDPLAWATQHHIDWESPVRPTAVG